MVFLDNGGGAPRGTVALSLPPPDLDGLVEHIVIQTHPPQARDWRVVPDLSPHLIVSVVDGVRGRQARAALVGARSRPVTIDVSRRIVTVGVRFRPGALPALLSVPAADLTDRAVLLPDAFPARVLREAAIGPDAPPELLAAELLRLVRRVARDVAPDPLCAALTRARLVRGMSAALGLAERTLRDRVIREIGLAPKRALSIARLHRALFAAQAGRSWAAAAHAAGYADQAHLARDCRVLLGDSPSGWLARGSADSFKTSGLPRR